MATFKHQVPIVYKEQKINTGLIIILTMVSMVIGGVSGYQHGWKLYANPKVLKTIQKLKNYIKELKRARRYSRRETETAK